MNNYKYPFNTAYTQAKELYGVELNPDEFETIGMTAWSRIGNKQYRLYKFSGCPVDQGNCSYKLDLPCNVDQIEAVTSSTEDWTNTSNVTYTNNSMNGWIEQYIEGGKLNRNDLYVSGGYIKYTQIENSLYFDRPYSSVNILYKGFIADDEGLPYLTEKEVDAIATFCAYTNDFKQARISKDTATFQMSQYLKQEWLQKCTQARIPDYLNQNEMNSILDAATSWDRKRFGKSFKPVIY